MTACPDKVALAGVASPTGRARRCGLVSGIAGGGLLLLALSLLGGGAPAAESRFEIYPLPAEANPGRVEVWLKNQRLPVATRRIWHSDSSGQSYMEVVCARFAAEGAVQLQLEAKSADLGQPVLRGVGRDLPCRHPGPNALTFDLPGPGQYYLQLPALARSNCTFTVAFWVDDLRRLEQARARMEGPGAVNVATLGVRANATLDQSAAIQSLLDQGGVIFFPAGVYRTGTLHLRSDTTVFLSPGAVIRALDKEDAVGSEFIAIENARHVTLCGPGMIDANSFTARRKHNVHNVNITGSRDVTFEDVWFEESNSWAVHIRKSDRFTARNVRVFSGKDGFDPDASRDVLIDGAFVVSGDDAIAVKNRFPREEGGKVTERVRFSNSIVSTFKSALKIGTETRGPIRDVTFENCDVFDSDRGVVLYARDGGPVERATWRNLRLFLRDWPQEKESGTAFHLIVDRREGATPVRGCLIENVTADWIYRSEFAGLADAPLQGVALRDIRARVGIPKSGHPPLFVCRNHVDLRLAGLSVDWQGHEAKWSGLVSGTGLAVTEAGAGTASSPQRISPRTAAGDEAVPTPTDPMRENEVVK